MSVPLKPPISTRFFTKTGYSFFLTHIFHLSGYTIFMKKHEHKPDFHKLCSPGQNKIWAYVSPYIFFFFTAAIGGFLWEVLIFLVTEGQFRNRGFLYGPWLPVYGVGAVFMHLLLRKQKKHPVLVFFLAALLGSGIELLIGWFLNTFWGLRYWDYSGYFLNFHGYIALWSAVGFGIAGMLWVCWISGFLTRFLAKLPVRFVCIIHTLFILMLLADCAAALIFPNAGRGITF